MLPQQKRLDTAYIVGQLWPVVAWRDGLGPPWLDPKLAQFAKWRSRYFAATANLAWAQEQKWDLGAQAEPAT